MSQSIASLLAFSYLVLLALALPAGISPIGSSSFNSDSGSDLSADAHDKDILVHEEKRELVVTKHVTATVTLGEDGRKDPTSQVHSFQSSPAAATPMAIAAAAAAASPSWNNEFRDGTIPCSQFPPAKYGAIKLDNLGFGGWTSLQTFNGQTVGECKEGVYCSYACPPGMSKTQWPLMQPANGASVGGLLCKNGFLYRSNTDESSLCKPDVGGVTISNTNSKAGIALCRTDYPGCEGMYIPTWVGPQQSGVPVSVLDSAAYYKWKGKETSTQYYVNNYGVSVEQGCVWGTPGSTVGNWAPLVVGSSRSNGITYVSLIENPNTPPVKANFNLRIAAADGNSKVIGDCRFENGVLSTPGGCTVSVLSGSARLIFY